MSQGGLGIGRQALAPLAAALSLAATLLLAACSGAPKQSSPPAETAHGPGGKAVSPRRGSRRSPYPPAQEDPSKRGDYTAGGLYAPHVRDSAPDYVPDVDAIPEPEVVDEPRSAYGNRSPYKVLGKTYHVLERPDDFVERGRASYYGNKFHGRRTSNLEVYDMYAFTAAHKSLPLPSFARVTNLDNGRSVVVRVNDRGPFHEGRVVDLSWAAAVKLDMHRAGTAQVEVRALSPGENARRDHEAVAATPPATVEASAPPASTSAIDQLVEALPLATASAGERPAAAPAGAQPANAQPEPAAVEDWRFDMMRDGRVMTADEFDAWMASRRIRVATGKPGVPDPVPTAIEPPIPVVSPAQAVAEIETEIPATAAGTGVTLQVAAFGAKANAERALSMLRGAGIDGARMVDGNSGGKPVWRVRVGPVDAATVAELSARFAGLGFGQPHVVRE
ncbi:septal ring lytic transglycosylase RlpA family protein [Luteimonas suaedae]|uniref:septal ring lytic transglycosylase RlpA family protein n=1 Tax=Luteimonas suaedae TaxID=2605430 RepID=UPI002102A9DA|nr:septal ring lytic transglycosylase RlpA family protein [Luteimonas suaedae]